MQLSNIRFKLKVSVNAKLRCWIYIYFEIVKF